MIFSLISRISSAATSLSCLTRVIVKCIILCLALFLFSCQDDSPGKKEDPLQEIAFSVSRQLSDKSGGRLTAEDISEVTKAIVTITHEDDNPTDFTNTPIEVFLMDGRVFTETISLETGNYRLKAFGLANNGNEVLFATPLQGSPSAVNVSTPLIINFEVEPQTSNMVDVEVVSVHNQNPSDFGFEFFEVGVIETIDFLIRVSGLGATGFIPSTLKIMYGNNYEYTQALTDPINPVQVREQDTMDYTIRITASGYETYTSVLTPAELKSYESEEEIFEVELIVQASATTFSRTYGGSDYDVSNSIRQTSDGGYIMAGRINSTDGDVGQNNGKADFWILKLDAEGNPEWEQAYGGSGDDEANAIRQTSDGGYIVAGYANGDVKNINKTMDASLWVLKLDAQGIMEWEQTYGGPGYDEANAIQQTSDGGYIVAGTSGASGGDVGQNKGERDFWILKLDGQGNLQWEQSYGGPGGDEAYSIQQTSDGGYIMAGASGASGGDVGENKGEHDIWIVKLDGLGGLLWEQAYGGSGQDAALSIQLTSDGGYIAAGHSTSPDGDVGQNMGNADFWIVKLDNSGDLDWKQSYGGSKRDVAHSVQQTPEGHCIVAGYTLSSDGHIGENKGDSDLWILKLDGNGSLISEQAYGGSTDDRAHSLHLTSDGGYILGGYSYSSDGDIGENKGEHDFWIVKLDAEGNL